MLKVTSNGRSSVANDDATSDDAADCGERALQLEEADRLYDEAHEERMRRKEDRINQLEDMLATLEHRARQFTGGTPPSATTSTAHDSSILTSLGLSEQRPARSPKDDLPRALRSTLDMLPMAHSGASLAGYRRRRTSHSARSDTSGKSQRSNGSVKNSSPPPFSNESTAPSLVKLQDVSPVARPTATSGVPCLSSNRPRKTESESSTMPAKSRLRKSPIQRPVALTSTREETSPVAAYTQVHGRLSPAGSPSTTSPKSAASMSPSTAPEPLYVPSHYATAFASRFAPPATLPPPQSQPQTIVPPSTSAHESPLTIPASWSDAEQNMWNVTLGSSFEPYYVPHPNHPSQGPYPNHPSQGPSNAHPSAPHFRDSLGPITYYGSAMGYATTATPQEPYSEWPSFSPHPYTFGGDSMNPPGEHEASYTSWPEEHRQRTMSSQPVYGHGPAQPIYSSDSLANGNERQQQQQR
ncbi:hypothetical protein ACM66B_002919 [Microbotryomycetes sp. NB124-2]